MLIDPQGAPNRAGGAGGRQDAIVGVVADVLARPVVEMEGKRTEAHIAPLQPGVEGAHRQFRIFSPPTGHRLVETIEADQVIAPEPHIAALDAALALAGARV